MARDRQRAKQRRREREAPNAPKRNKKRDRAQASPERAFTDPEVLDAASNSGVEDVLDEQGPEGTTPAPDPLKHASPYVDEAKLAEAGAQLPEDDQADPYHAHDVDPGDEVMATGDEDFEGEDELERAPDEVENDLLPAGAGTRASFDPAVAAEHAPRERRQRGRVITFLGHCVDELRRVQWPNRRQVGQATGVVLAFVIVAGGYLGALDALWKPIVNAII